MYTNNTRKEIHNTVKQSGFTVSYLIEEAGINRNTYYFSWLKGGGRESTDRKVREAYHKIINHGQEN